MKRFILAMLMIGFLLPTPVHSGDGSARLAEVKTWMYQLQGLNDEMRMQALQATDYDMLVIEPGHNFSEHPYNTRELVKQLRHKPDGSPRLLLAYIDIGQAEDYRDYWKADWRAPGPGKPGHPDFLLTIDPDGWSGNYPVAYWRAEWKAIWLGKTGIIAELARLGFDGVYLDWVEAYDDEDVMAAAENEGIDGETSMIEFIEQIGATGRTITPGFLVVAQNAPYLLDTNPTRYAQAIDAVAMEDTWFNGEGDADWNDPKAGDLHTHHMDDYATPLRLTQYAKYLALGIPVFTIDYCVSKANAALVYREARKHGFIPLVTRVSLSRLTETPPN